MTSIKRLAGALCLALSFSSYSNAQVTATGQLDPTQVYSTPNLVIPTLQGQGGTPWVNGVYQDSLTCWAWGDPGYCGPNPIVRPGGNINFSFGMTNLYQAQSIANVLPNTGSGLRINGYNYGFTAKNGNGWDNGQTDYLSAYVSFYDPKGSLVYNKNYNLNYQFNWTTFNYSENFTTPFASKDLGTVQYGFVGGDSNYWAGPYGPEIYNVNFSLKYSVDPCAVNVLSSPSCPGYFEELAKLNSTPTTTLVTVETTPTTSTVVTNDPVSPVTTTYVAPATISTTSAPVTSSITTPVTTSSNPTQERTVSGPSLSAILNIVRTEQTRISSVESSAVQQANEAASSASSQAQKTAESVASSAVTNSQSFQSSTVQSSGSGLVVNNQSTSVVNIGGLRPPQPTQMTIETATSTSITSTSSAISNFIAGISRAQTTQNTEQEALKLNSIDFAARSPLKDYLDTRPQISQETNQPSQRQPEVKRNVPENDLANGVTLTAMAKQPPGFELYQLGMRDAAFYAPKEIYKNQKVIDNQRVLRQLNNRSDRIHQEMVDEQYKNR